MIYFLHWSQSLYLNWNIPKFVPVCGVRIEKKQPWGWEKKTWEAIAGWSSYRKKETFLLGLISSFNSKCAGGINIPLGNGFWELQVPQKGHSVAKDRLRGLDNRPLTLQPRCRTVCEALQQTALLQTSPALKMSRSKFSEDHLRAKMSRQILK